MKPVFALAFFLGATSMAHATTHYQQLAQMFAQGTKPALSQLATAYAGRCFYSAPIDGVSAGQDDATGSVLFGMMSTPPSSAADDGGPLFPAQPPTPRLFVNVFNSACDTSNCDVHYRWDDAKLTADDIQKAMKDDGIKSTPVQDDGTELTWTSDYSGAVNGGPQGTFQAKMSQSYLVVHSTVVAAKGAAEMYCYFYKKLQQ